MTRRWILTFGIVMIALAMSFACAEPDRNS